MRKAVIKYAVLSLLGIVLFNLCSKLALNERGYYAIGGEVFMLLLPFFYYIITSTAREVYRDCKNMWEEMKK
ncbi:MAG: hypothetical protein RR365_08875 [Bacteroides sp.]